MPQSDKVPPKRKVGRPRGAVGVVAEARKMTVREYAMTHVFEAIDVWAEIMKDKEQPGTARAAAASHIVNRAIGQPAVAAATDADTADRTIERIERVIIDQAEAKAKADA